jgi:hypothetical protein
MRLDWIALASKAGLTVQAGAGAIAIAYWHMRFETVSIRPVTEHSQNETY